MATPTTGGALDATLNNTSNLLFGDQNAPISLTGSAAVTAKRGLGGTGTAPVVAGLANASATMQQLDAWAMGNGPMLSREQVASLGLTGEQQAAILHAQDRANSGDVSKESSGRKIADVLSPRIQQLSTDAQKQAASNPVIAQQLANADLSGLTNSQAGLLAPQIGTQLTNSLNQSVAKFQQAGSLSTPAPGMAESVMAATAGRLNGAGLERLDPNANQYLSQLANNPYIAGLASNQYGEALANSAQGNYDRIMANPYTGQIMANPYTARIMDNQLLNQASGSAADLVSGATQQRMGVGQATNAANAVGGAGQQYMDAGEGTIGQQLAQAGQANQDLGLVRSIAMGQGPSAATVLGQKMIEDQQRAMQSFAATARGGAVAGAQRTAMLAGSDAALRGYQDILQARATEQLTATGQLGAANKAAGDILYQAGNTASTLANTDVNRQSQKAATLANIYGTSMQGAATGTTAQATNANTYMAGASNAAKTYADSAIGAANNYTTSSIGAANSYNNAMGTAAQVLQSGKETQATTQAQIDSNAANIYAQQIANQEAAGQQRVRDAGTLTSNLLGAATGGATSAYNTDVSAQTAKAQIDAANKGPSRGAKVLTGAATGAAAGATLGPVGAGVGGLLGGALGAIA